jgi:hypothetical protein
MSAILRISHYLVISEVKKDVRIVSANRICMYVNNGVQ